jgi:hypothetical protein
VAANTKLHVPYVVQQYCDYTTCRYVRHTARHVGVSRYEKLHAVYTIDGRTPATSARSKIQTLVQATMLFSRLSVINAANKRKTPKIIDTRSPQVSHMVICNNDCRYRGGLMFILFSKGILEGTSGFVTRIHTRVSHWHTLAP